MALPVTVGPARTRDSELRESDALARLGQPEYPDSPR